MAFSSFKKILVNGLALAIPLAVVVYVFIRITGMFTKLIAPVAHKIGVEHLLGGITLTVIAVLLIIIIILLLGLLMRVAFVVTVRQQMENIILRFIPSLNQLKVMAADKLDVDTARNAWKPVIALMGNQYNAAFVVEEDEELITLFVCKGTSLTSGDIVVTSKEDVKLMPVEYSSLRKCSRAFGKGYISLVKTKTSNV